MLRQLFTAPSRTLRPVSRLAAARPLPRPQFDLASPATSRTLPAAVRARWYSDAAKDAAETPKEAAPADGAATVPEAEAELQKKLEEKQKEALDFKVRSHSPAWAHRRSRHPQSMQPSR